ncbi:MAG: RNA polymerase sigma factor [Pseudomonadota bacterium]
MKQPRVEIDSNRYDEDERRWARLMSQAQAGDQAAYAQLLEEISITIEDFVRHRFGQIEMLEDCVQECLVSVHQARHTYDPARAFRPWLFTLVRHRTIDLLRRGSSWHRLQRQPLPSASTTSEALNRLIDGAHALARIPEDLRKAVILVKYEGLTAKEAASRLGIRESALKGRLRRGLEAVFAELNREGSAGR